MIKKKADITDFLNQFEVIANNDGAKNFLTFNTKKPKGTLTIMKYPNGQFTYHRKNELYWDIKEIQISNEILPDIIWVFRKAINERIKDKLVNITK